MEEEKYMRRCIGLARNGLCNTPPNPMVGAVIVHEGKIIGEGYHVRCGEAHAEVNAIRSVKDPSLLSRSTIYVSLEPCSHHGKTPPCCDLLIRHRIPRVVIGCVDPFAAVAGRGIAKLRAAGCEVKVGVLEDECRQLIARFVTFHTCRRPYVTLKWAASADGFIDRLRNSLEEAPPVIFSTPLTSLIAHKRRAEHSAVLVGGHTAELDNPSLTVRRWYGRNPVRVAAGRTFVPSAAPHLLDGSAPTLLFTSAATAAAFGKEYAEKAHAFAGEAPECIALPDAEADTLPFILHTLHERGLQSLLVEGGSRLLQSFIDAGLWDEIHVEESPLLLRTGVKAPVVSGEYLAGEEVVFGHKFRHYARKADDCR